MPPPAERHVTRDVRNREGTCFVEGHARWDRECLGLLCHRLLGEPTPGEDCHHAVARSESRHAVAASRDNARGLESRAEGKRRARLVIPGDHDGIGVVYRRGSHVDEHLVSGWRGRRDFLNFERIDWTPRTTCHCPHLYFPLSCRHDEYPMYSNTRYHCDVGKHHLLCR